MTVKQAAKQLELSYKSVYRLIEQGDLACQRIGPGRGKIVLTEEDIQQYRKSCEYTVPAAQQQEIRRRNLVMYVAHMTTAKAIKSGELRRQPCEECGNKKVHAHHDDYTKPLDVRWLCVKHHGQLHGELKREKRRTLA